MGNIIPDSAVSDILYQLNLRFAPGEPLREMVANQRDFHIFAENHSLRQIYRLLRIVPSDPRERERWFKYLDLLKTYDSDQAGVNGHDRIVQARRENLESDTPLPMYLQTHAAADNRFVTVSRGHPMPHETQEYVVISVPTAPAADLDRTSRIAARVRRIAESVGA